MRDIFTLFLHAIVIVIRLGRPGGLRSVVAESVLMRHQVLILNRGRKRAPNFRASDRIIAGLCTLVMGQTRVLRSAIVLKPSTLLHFHKMLTKQKYRLLFSPERVRRPGPKGPTKELIDAVVEMKRRNRTWGCKRIAQQIALAFGVDIDKDVVRRILGIHFGPETGCGGVDGMALCRMFHRAIHMQTPPKYLSSDHDPLYQFHQWQANLRVLDVKEIKTVPYVPLSHPFVERLIGTIRREYLDQTLFWTAADLEEKLRVFQRYFNRDRAHSGLEGGLPEPGEAQATLSFASYRWQQHCRGLYQTPIAA
jgi:putative transposase